VPEKSAELLSPAAESLSWFGMAPGASAELIARFAILPTPSAEELSLAAE
jgi:hypothetical protein